MRERERGREREKEKETGRGRELDSKRGKKSSIVVSEEILAFLSQWLKDNMEYSTFVSSRNEHRRGGVRDRERCTKKRNIHITRLVMDL